MNETLYRTHLHAAVTDYANRLRKTEGLFPVDTETFNQHLDRIPAFACMFYGVPKEAITREDLVKKLKALGIEPQEETNLAAIDLKRITKEVVTRWYSASADEVTGIFPVLDINTIQGFVKEISREADRIEKHYSLDDILLAIDRRVFLLTHLPL